METLRSSRARSSIPTLILLAALLGSALAFAKSTDVTHSLSDAEIETSLQECSIVKALSNSKKAKHDATSSSVKQIFAILFPGSPAVNSLLATLYISGPPNFLLALCPPNIDPSSLSVMVAFAVGGLLGDTILHLLPEIFLGEDEPDQARFVMVNPNKNLVLGMGIIVGFVTFMAIEKGMRIAAGGANVHDHSHNSNSEKLMKGSELKSTDQAKTSALQSEGSARSRKSKLKSASATAEQSLQSDGPSSEVKLGGYLNLIADFTHNITDGLALSSSFYASPTVGATTTVAVFFHEIPHEVGDFALLISAGFSKKKAMGAQFITAVGAFLGTFIGIAIQEFGKPLPEHAEKSLHSGLFGTSLGWDDMLLPFTAGTFLYVGTVAVIPELLETGPQKGPELRKTAIQFLAMAAGAVFHGIERAMEKTVTSPRTLEAGKQI